MAITDVALKFDVCGVDLEIGEIEPAPLELVPAQWHALHGDHPPELVHAWQQSVVEDHANYCREYREEQAGEQ